MKKNQCLKTLTGFHLWEEAEKMCRFIIHRGKTIQHQCFYKCGACGMIDDKNIEKSSPSKERE